MASSKILKIIGRLSAPVFQHFNSVYLVFYSFYKQLTDALNLSIIKEYVQPGQAVVDVGAHIGYYSRVLADSVGPGGKVYAFEPEARNFGFLKKNTKKYPWVDSYNQAVGAASGSLNLFLSETLNVDHHTYASSNESRRAVTIEAVSLDDFFSKEAKKISFIKMDIQGYEEAAVRGMIKVLQTHRPVVLTELWPWGLQQAGSSAARLLSHFDKCDYELYLINEHQNKLEKFQVDRLPGLEDDYYDLLCLPRERTQNLSINQNRV